MPADASIKFTLLENGLDFVLSALEHISGEPTSRDLKYAVLHLSSGIELILKERLVREHWTLVFDKIEKTDKSKFKTGNFNSANFDQCIDRLIKVCEVGIDQRTKTDLKNFRDRRNKIEHFEFDESPAAMKSASSRVLNFLIDFIHEELSPNDAIEHELNQVLEYLREFDTFVQQRMEIVKGQVRGSYSPVKTCPRCFQEAVTIDGGTAECHFCRYSASGEDVADEYLSEVLNLSSYEIGTNGGEWPVYNCPECNTTALVHEEDEFTCFSCGEHWDTSEMTFCEDCGEPFALQVLQTDDDDEIVSFLCTQCWENRMAD